MTGRCCTIQCGRVGPLVPPVVHDATASEFGDHKGVGKGVSELRIDCGPVYHVYYGLDGEKLVILLVGGTKERQPRDMETAQTCGMTYQAGEAKMPVKEHRASDYLSPPQDIVAYLNAAIEEFEGEPRLLMTAFRNVAAAQVGVSEVARRADIDRVRLSRALSGNRDPRLGMVTKIASAYGVRLRSVA